MDQFKHIQNMRVLVENKNIKKENLFKKRPLVNENVLNSMNDKPVIGDKIDLTDNRVIPSVKNKDFRKNVGYGNKNN